MLPLCTGGVLLLALVWELVRPSFRHSARHAIARLRHLRPEPASERYDPGRESRAELRARALLRSCIDDRDWQMYRDLGFLRVHGAVPDGAARSSYAYIIYPHKPIVAYVPDSGELLNEYCVAFPDHSRPYGSARLPDSDDVLAKWMAITGDERGLIGEANMHLPGRQVDPERVRRDIARLERWEVTHPVGERSGAARQPSHAARNIGGVRAA